MLNYTWQDFDTDAQRIAAAIRNSRKSYQAVYAIPRGGYILGVYLSHTFNLPMFITDWPSALAERVLVVDDNTVTGSELAPFVANGATTAVLVHNPLGSRVTPAYFGRESLDWPIFPWEADSCMTLEGSN